MVNIHQEVGLGREELQQQGYTEHFLPTVNHEQALKRAKNQFTCLGDMFVFYNQLLNCRQIMASTLYQKLHNTEVISMEYTSI